MSQMSRGNPQLERLYVIPKYRILVALQLSEAAQFRFALLSLQSDHLSALSGSRCSAEYSRSGSV